MLADPIVIVGAPSPPRIACGARGVRSATPCAGVNSEPPSAAPAAAAGDDAGAEKGLPRPKTPAGVFGLDEPPGAAFSAAFSAEGSAFSEG